MHPCPTYYDDSTWADLRRDQCVIHSIIQLDMKPEEAMEAQLKARGMDPQTFACVVLTHMHIDHVGGVPMFGARIPVWTARAEVQVRCCAPPPPPPCPAPWPCRRGISASL